MEVVDWFNKFGPMGAMFIFLISAIIYHTKWLRAWQEAAAQATTEERIRVDERNDKIRQEFINALERQQNGFTNASEKQQNNFNFSMEKIVVEFRTAMKELVEKHDHLSDKVDSVQEDVKEMLQRYR